MWTIYALKNAKLDFALKDFETVEKAEEKALELELKGYKCLVLDDEFPIEKKFRQISKEMDKIKENEQGKLF